MSELEHHRHCVKTVGLEPPWICHEDCPVKAEEAAAEQPWATIQKALGVAKKKEEAYRTALQRLKESNAHWQTKFHTEQTKTERLRVQLAGCSTAALGQGEPVGPDAYGWSASYQDVVELRQKYEAAQEDRCEFDGCKKRVTMCEDHLEGEACDAARELESTVDEQRSRAARALDALCHSAAGTCVRCGGEAGENKACLVCNAIHQLALIGDPL